MLALYRDDAYNLVLFIHIVAVFISIIPAVAHPIMFEFEKRRDDGDIVALAKRTSAVSRIYVVALAVGGLIGFGLISMSDGVIEWGDMWVSLSMLIWLAMNGAYHGAMLPAEKALAGGDESAMKKIDTFGRILAAMVLVLTYLMVMQPG